MEKEIKGAENGTGENEGLKWFEVTATETYTRTFRVLAKDKEDAENVLNESINCGDVDCETGEGREYNREIGEIVEVKSGEYVNTNESDGYVKR